MEAGGGGGHRCASQRSWPCVLPGPGPNSQRLGAALSTWLSSAGFPRIPARAAGSEESATPSSTWSWVTACGGLLGDGPLVPGASCSRSPSPCPPPPAAHELLIRLLVCLPLDNRKEKNRIKPNARPRHQILKCVLCRWGGGCRGLWDGPAPLMTHSLAPGRGLLGPKGGCSRQGGGSAGGWAGARLKLLLGSRVNGAWREA